MIGDGGQLGLMDAVPDLPPADATIAIAWATASSLTPPGGRVLAAFQVDGLPKPKGSMSARVVTRGDGSQFASTFASKGKNRPWRKLVKAAAALAWGKDRPAVACDVILEAIFMFARPQSHHLGDDRSRPLRPSAPRFCQAHNRGDLSKLLRCVEDEITAAGVWVDDRQVVGFGRSTKLWADADRALFRIAEAA